MKRMAAIAVALATAALMVQGGAAGAVSGGLVTATLRVSIYEGNATFVATYDPTVAMDGTIRLIPKPIVFVYHPETASWESGDIDARLVFAGNSEVASLIPKCDMELDGQVFVALGGPLVLSSDPLSPGTAVLGPVPLIGFELEENGGSTIVHVRPDIGDDAF